MSDIAEILEQFDYAETITKTVANGMLEVTVAEASHKRNRAFGQAMLQVMMRDDINSVQDLTEEIEIDIFCDTLLKRWNLTRNGKAVPIEEAKDIFKANRAGSLLFREVGEIAATAANFLEKPSKKKTSSKSTTRKKALKGQAQTFARQAQARGHSIPARIERHLERTSDPWMIAAYDAHETLKTCRNHQGDIPWTAIDAYARRYGIEDFEAFEDVIYGLERIDRLMIVPPPKEGNKGKGK